MKKRVAALLLAAALCLLTGCTKAPTLPKADYPLELTFSSGAGAWRTILTLNADGSFTGYYSDSDMGDLDDAYPNGTFYFCSFSGRFEPSPTTDAAATPLRLAELTCDEDIPQEEIRNGIRRIHAGPHGFYHFETNAPAETAILYAPGTPITDLDEEMLSWWPGRFAPDTPDALEGYALWLPEVGTAFFS